MLTTPIIAIAAGVLLIWLARFLRVPPVTPLLIGGVLLGPEFAGIVRPETLGGGLDAIVSLAVAVVLFEGALSLDPRGYREAPVVIRRLLTTGALVTWAGATLALNLVAEIPLPFALLGGSLVIVTGPTVVTPILRRVRVTERLHQILYWESVLIDPVGVFIAVLCFEFLTSGSEPWLAPQLFLSRVAIGAAVGAVTGVVISQVVRRSWIPEDLVNVVVLGMALGAFGLSNTLVHDSGILSVVVAGFVVAALQTPNLRRVRRFKEELTYLCVGVLFILLAANLRFADFAHLGTRGLLVVAAVVFVLRPLAVLACTVGRSVSSAERAFLSWLAPRGIVAASMASLFALRLEALGHPEGRFLQAFTYAVIAATVLLQGSSAGLVARLLGVQRPARTGWAIVGAHAFARGLARFFRDEARVPCVLIDRNRVDVAEAAAQGLEVIEIDALDPELSDAPSLAAVGNVLALTDNEELNALVAASWARTVGASRVHRWAASTKGGVAAAPGSVVWSELPKPSVVSAELVRREARLRLAAPGSAPGPAGARGRVLVTVERGRISLDGAADAKGGGGPRLVLHRADVELEALLDARLHARVPGGDLEAVLRSLLVVARRRAPGLDVEALLAELVARERNFSTALGNGVAVPHANTELVGEPMCVIGQLESDADFRAHDGQPVRAVFLLLSPPGAPEAHLARLAAIASLASDPAFARSLAAAPSFDEVAELIRRRGR